jgi:hypothetical protein
VIAYSLSSIPPQTTHLVLIFFNNHGTNENPSTSFPLTLTSLTLRVFDESIDKIPSIISQLVLQRTSTNQLINFHPHSLTLKLDGILTTS